MQAARTQRGEDADGQQGGRGPLPAGQRRVNPEAKPPVTSQSPAIIMELAITANLIA